MVLRVFVFALMVMVGFGCKKPKNKVPDIPIGFSAQKNNVKWTGTKYSAYVYTTFTNGLLDTSLQLEAYDTINKDFLGINIKHWRGETGIYNYPGVAYFLFDSNYNTNTYIYYSVSGNITITKISSDNIQGTFNAITRDDFDNSASFTNGVFNIPYDPL